MTTYLSADDFLTGITGGTEDFEIPGIGKIQIRSLSVADVKTIDAKAKGNEIDAGLLMAAAGIVEPKLSAEQLEKLQSARPGIIAKISRRVSQLSGMTAEADPLVGAGS